MAPTRERDRLIEQATAFVQALAGRFSDRSVGGEGNRAATALFVEHAEHFGLEVARTPFEHLRWDGGEAELAAGGREWALHAGPCSTACDLSAPLTAAARVEELETEETHGTVVRD